MNFVMETPEKGVQYTVSERDWIPPEEHAEGNDPPRNMCRKAAVIMNRERLASAQPDRDVHSSRIGDVRP